jgi:hypothetical protein
VIVHGWIAAQSSFGATIPAGRPLVVRRNDTISSRDKSGRPFHAHADRDMVVNGKTLFTAGATLPRGTRLEFSLASRLLYEQRQLFAASLRSLG